jgi:hypothetical protein
MMTQAAQFKIRTMISTVGVSLDDETRFAVVLPPDATSLQIRVRLHADDRFARYKLSFQTSTGHLVWQVSDLAAQLDDGKAVLAADIPAALPSGTYRVIVESGGSSLGVAVLDVRH